MGLLNPKNVNFKKAVNSEIYVDKSEMIKEINKLIDTEQRFICISRPRRFGKSITANMLTAYYGRNCDLKELFSNLKISKADSFEKYLNKYNVIHINMVDYFTESNSIQELIKFLEEDIIYEIERKIEVNLPRRKTLVKAFEEVFSETGISFIFIIDEWDCIFRVHKNDRESQTEYLNFLRNILKDKSYVALAYMTGILPIKKYAEHSALNMFTEISMTNPREYSSFTGFTEDEVRELCQRYDMSIEETKKWYDGYNLKGVSVYNPHSVVMSMTGRDYSNYWTSTETYEALKVYIQMNFDGLRDKVVKMISGERVKVNTGKFQNDMTTFNSADDVLTLLIHLGYLTFENIEAGNGEVWIPNSEVQQEFINCIEDGGWENVMEAINQSEKLLKATISGKEELIAEKVEEVHRKNTSIIQYHDENSLSCVLSLAYYSARRSYNIYRELQGGEGYADLVFIPRKNNNNPAMIIELKWNKDVETAITQIKKRKYVESLKDYHGEIILVGITYDRESKQDNKKHICKIEKVII